MQTTARLINLKKRLDKKVNPKQLPTWWELGLPEELAIKHGLKGGSGIPPVK